MAKSNVTEEKKVSPLEADITNILFMGLFVEELVCPHETSRTLILYKKRKHLGKDKKTIGAITYSYNGKDVLSVEFHGKGGRVVRFFKENFKQYGKESNKKTQKKNTD